MIGRRVSFWEGPFSGHMLVLGRVFGKALKIIINEEVRWPYFLGGYP